LNGFAGLVGAGGFVGIVVGIAFLFNTIQSGLLISKHLCLFV